MSDFSIWSHIDTIDEFSALATMYLQGKLQNTPFMVGPIEKETIPLVKDFVEINKRGFITTESQPESYQTGINKSGKWYETKQAAYVTGFLPTKYVSSIGKRMADLGFNVITCRYTISTGKFTFKSYLNGGVEFPFTVTYTRGADSKDKLSATKWKEQSKITENHCKFWKTQLAFLKGDSPKLEEIFKTTYSGISIFSTRHGDEKSDGDVLSKQLVKAVNEKMKPIDQSVIDKMEQMLLVNDMKIVAELYEKSKKGKISGKTRFILAYASTYMIEYLKVTILEMVENYMRDNKTDVNEAIRALEKDNNSLTYAITFLKKLDANPLSFDLLEGITNIESL